MHRHNRCHISARVFSFLRPERLGARQMRPFARELAYMAKAVKLVFTNRFVSNLPVAG